MPPKFGMRRELITQKDNLRWVHARALAAHQT